MTALEFSEVRFRYTAESPLLLDGLSFRVEAGEFVSILGPSGAGKSSLFRLMNVLLAPESGSISVGGLPVSEKRRCCGYMPQQDLLFPWRTVAENVPTVSRSGKRELRKCWRRWASETGRKRVRLRSPAVCDSGRLLRAPCSPARNSSYSMSPFLRSTI